MKNRNNKKDEQQNDDEEDEQQNDDEEEYYQQYISGKEILNSKKLWIADTQSNICNDPKFEQFKKQLRLFKDKMGLWRCG